MPAQCYKGHCSVRLETSSICMRRKMKQVYPSSGTREVCSVVSDSSAPLTVAYQSPLSKGILQGKNTEVGCHALFQGLFPTQGSNPGLPHCRQILYHLSHQGSRWIPERVAYPFSWGYSQPRNQTYQVWPYPTLVGSWVANYRIF